MKKLVLLSLVMCGAMVASANSYLYWMVDNPTVAGGSVPASEYKFARLSATDGNEIESLALAGGSTGTSWADVSAYANTDYSFFVELLNDDYDVMTAQKNIGTYAELSNYIKDSAMDMTQMAINVNSFNVPEPTSGLLMLLGVGLLGLKRKKV